MTLLNKIKSSDYTATILEKEPSVRSVISYDTDNTLYVQYLKEGMRAAVTYGLGTAHSVFGDYGIPVAAKTGTVQTSNTFNDGVFICYAPADDPEIAIAVVVEKGGGGAGIMPAARLVLDEYFRSRTTHGAVTEGVLIP